MKRIQFQIVVDLELLLASSGGIRNVELKNKKAQNEIQQQQRVRDVKK